MKQTDAQQNDVACDGLYSTRCIYCNLVLLCFLFCCRLYHFVRSKSAITHRVGLKNTKLTLALSLDLIEPDTNNLISAGGVFLLFH